MKATLTSTDFNVNFDRHLDARDARRQSAEARYHDRRVKREELAAKQVGELSNGRFYVFPVGGKYKEASNEWELVDYLIRNNYA
jgi:hypothetical protein